MKFNHNNSRYTITINLMKKGKLEKYKILLKDCDNFYKYLIHTAPGGGNIHEYNTTSV